MSEFMTVARVWPLLLVVCACSSEVVETEPVVARALSARLGTDGGALFRKLEVGATGVDFANLLRDENNLPYIYSGAGVAVGDYDQDGMPDVYLVSQDGPNKLFRQVAPLRFEDVTEAAGGLGGGEAWGTAPAFADVDGDGDLDLYVCNLEAPNLLFQNQGDGTFVECAGKFGLAVVAASMGCSFADYDNDGDLDLYLLTNRVFGPSLPQGIVDEVRPPADTRTTLAEMFPPYPEFGREDGKPVVPAGYENFFSVLDGQIFPAGQPDRLFRNDGYAQFTDVTNEAGIVDHGQGLSVTWWDFDDDGWLDIYVANDLESPDTLYHNLGNGKFADVTRDRLPNTAYFGMGSDFGDIDGDGRLDLCVADMSSTTHYMSKLLMGSMGDKRWFLMNADPPQQMRNSVFLNTGTDRFLEAARLLNLASTDWTWTVRFVDLDEDGWLDFYATNGQPIFDNDPDAGSEFTRLWRMQLRDQALDVIRKLDPVTERNIARRNTGALAFEDVGPAWGLDEQTVSHGAAFADLDGDGDLDLVVNNLNQPASLYENRSADTHRVTIALRGTVSNTHGVGARLTLEAGGRTQTELVIPTRGYMSAGQPVAHFGLGAATEITRLEIRWPSGIVQTLTDLAADHAYTIREPGAEHAPVRPHPNPPGPRLPTHTELALANDSRAPDWRHTERDFDDYAIQPLLPHRLSRLGPGIATGDIDGDGTDELWCGGAAGQPGALFAHTDAGWTERPGPWSQDSECEDLGAVFLDSDSDGDLDLYVVSGGVEAQTDDTLLADRLYLNDGTGTFTRAPDDALPDRAFSGSSVTAADFDRDGDLDLFVGARVTPGQFPLAPASALLRNDGGRFVEVTSDLAPSLTSAGMVTAAVWTDFDADGWVDLVVAAQWQPIRVLRNVEGQRFEDATAAAGLADRHGQWNGIAAADLDQDGDEDLVVTNLGINTKYKASAKKPLRLYADDFDGNGTADVIEAKYEGDTLLPVRGRSCSSQAMPFLAEKFQTFDAFAKASLPEIYGADELAKSTSLVTDELRHFVLENTGGAFAPHPLPRLAQIAPTFGIGIADLNGDGHLDLFLAQNFASPEPESGRFDGGLSQLLHGDGTLRFEPVPPAESGVVIPEDAMAVATWASPDHSAPTLVVSLNDGPLRLLAALRVQIFSDDTHRRAVRLHGPPGNPTGIGARITLRATDTAHAQSRTFHAGSGYLSQSAARAHFTDARVGRILEVRWPDGTTTTHTIGDDDERTIVLER